MKENLEKIKKMKSFELEPEQIRIKIGMHCGKRISELPTKYLKWNFQQST